MLILVSMCCHQGHGDIWPQVAAKGHVWIDSPAAARVCVDMHSRGVTGVTRTMYAGIQGQCWSCPH